MVSEEEITPGHDNASEVDIKNLEGHSLGVQKAQENFVKTENDTKLKFKKEGAFEIFTWLGISFDTTEKRYRNSIGGGRLRSLR